MKTIIHLELSDEERSHLAANIGGTHPVTRKEVTQLVIDYIQRKLSDQPEPDSVANALPEEAGKQQPDGARAKSAPEFVPSRGDEDYIAQPKDPRIAAACSRILDDTALIEQFAWNTIERNRK